MNKKSLKVFLKTGSEPRKVNVAEQSRVKKLFRLMVRHTRERHSRHRHEKRNTQKRWQEKKIEKKWDYTSQSLNKNTWSEALFDLFFCERKLIVSGQSCSSLWIRRRFHWFWRSFSLRSSRESLGCWCFEGHFRTRMSSTHYVEWIEYRSLFVLSEYLSHGLHRDCRSLDMSL